MRWVIVTVAAMLFCVGPALCQEAQRSEAEAPQSRQARDAISRHEAATRNAREDYLRQVIASTKQLQEDLGAAKAASMKAGDLEEANRIQTALEQAKLDLDRAQSELLGRHVFTILADKRWQPTVEVSKGQKVSVRASGEWSAAPGKVFGPEGGQWRSGADDQFYLQARIQDGTKPKTQDGPAIRVGERATITADADGVLELQMHDTRFNDNSGELRVEITVQR